MLLYNQVIIADLSGFGVEKVNLIQIVVENK